MTAAILGKDVRELAPSALALTLLGVFGLALCKAYLPTHDADIAAVVLAVMAWTCALVTSVQPFAHEVEAGTQTWLDALPVTRVSVWQSKAAAAAAMSLVQYAVLVATYVGLSLHDVGSAMGIALIAAAHGWAVGLCASSMARTSLGAVAWAVLLQMTMPHVLIAAVVVATVFSLSVERHVDAARVTVALVSLALPLLASRRMYSYIDRARGPAVARQRGPRLTDVRALVWLTWRQVRGLALVVFVAGALAGFVVPRVAPWLWPVVAYAVGAVMGIAAFADDQGGDAYRFLGDRRLPCGRIWLVKLGASFMAVACAVVPAVLMTITRIVAAEQLSAPGQPMPEAEHRGLLAVLSAASLVLGPLYGLAVGQFFGMSQRKPAVAVVLTAIVGAALAVALGPSITIGRFAAVQWVAPPLALFAATYLAMRPWVSGRFAGVRAFATTTGAAAAFAGLVAAGIYGRETEVPDRVSPFDVRAFQAARPTPERNEAGRAILAAAANFGDIRPSPDAASAKTMNEVSVAVTRGESPEDDAAMGAFLERALAEPWSAELTRAVALPTGVVETLTASQAEVNYPLIQRLANMGSLQAGMSLHRAKHGDIAAAIDRATIALALSRQLRSRANGQQFLTAAQIEAWALRCFGAAIDRPEATTDQLRTAVAALLRHEREIPDAAEAIQVEYLRVVELLATVQSPRTQPETQRQAACRIACLAPWELDRQQRIAALVTEGQLRSLAVPYAEAVKRIAGMGVVDPRSFRVPMYWTPDADDAGRRTINAVRLGRWMDTACWLDSFSGVGWIVPPTEVHGRVLRRAALLRTALALYEREKGRPAEALSALVPDILPTVPSDPVDGAPFRYRVSVGETLDSGGGDGPAGPQAGQTVEPGRGILWGVGPDCSDDGGVRSATGTAANFGFVPAPRGTDLIYLVPKPTKR